MNRAERARLARMSLDFRFAQGTVDALAQQPVRGWIRAIRDALGMTSRQLATRMDISQPAVSQLERSEEHGTIQLDSLRRAAHAMNCELVYAIVPRTTLDDTVRERARSIARREVAAIDLTMRLDDHGLGRAELKRRADAYATELMSSSRLWDEDRGS
jgi:predicted DNA-binding mobile mystery protein A